MDSSSSLSRPNSPDVFAGSKRLLEANEAETSSKKPKTEEESPGLPVSLFQERVSDPATNSTITLADKSVLLAEADRGDKETKLFLAIFTQDKEEYSIPFTPGSRYSLAYSLEELASISLEEIDHRMATIIETFNIPNQLGGLNCYTYSDRCALLDQAFNRLEKMKSTEARFLTGVIRILSFRKFDSQANVNRLLEGFRLILAANRQKGVDLVFHAIIDHDDSKEYDKKNVNKKNKVFAKFVNKELCAFVDDPRVLKNLQNLFYTFDIKQRSSLAVSILAEHLKQPYLSQGLRYVLYAIIDKVLHSDLCNGRIYDADSALLETIPLLESDAKSGIETAQSVLKHLIEVGIKGLNFRPRAIPYSQGIHLVSKYKYNASDSLKLLSKAAILPFVKEQETLISSFSTKELTTKDEIVSYFRHLAFKSYLQLLSPDLACEKVDKRLEHPYFGAIVITPQEMLDLLGEITPSRVIKNLQSDFAESQSSSAPSFLKTLFSVIQEEVAKLKLAPQIDDQGLISYSDDQWMIILLNIQLFEINKAVPYPHLLKLLSLISDEEKKGDFLTLLLNSDLTPTVKKQLIVDVLDEVAMEQRYIQRFLASRELKWEHIDLYFQTVSKDKVLANRQFFTQTLARVKNRFDLGSCSFFGKQYGTNNWYVHRNNLSTAATYNRSLQLKKDLPTSNTMKIGIWLELPEELEAQLILSELNIFSFLIPTNYSLDLTIPAAPLQMQRDTLFLQLVDFHQLNVDEMQKRMHHIATELKFDDMNRKLSEGEFLLLFRMALFYAWKTRNMTTKFNIGLNPDHPFNEAIDLKSYDLLALKDAYITPLPSCFSYDKYLHRMKEAKYSEGKFFTYLIQLYDSYKLIPQEMLVSYQKLYDALSGLVDMNEKRGTLFVHQAFLKFFANNTIPPMFKPLLQPEDAISKIFLIDDVNTRMDAFISHLISHHSKLAPELKSSIYEAIKKSIVPKLHIPQVRDRFREKIDKLLPILERDAKQIDHAYFLLIALIKKGKQTVLNIVPVQLQFPIFGGQVKLASSIFAPPPNIPEIAPYSTDRLGGFLSGLFADENKDQLVSLIIQFNSYTKELDEAAINSHQKPLAEFSKQELEPFLSNLGVKDLLCQLQVYIHSKLGCYLSNPAIMMVDDKQKEITALKIAHVMTYLEKLPLEERRVLFVDLLIELNACTVRQVEAIGDFYDLHILKKQALNSFMEVLTMHVILPIAHEFVNEVCEKLAQKAAPNQHLGVPVHQRLFVKHKILGPLNIIAQNDKIPNDPYLIFVQPLNVQATLNIFLQHRLTPYTIIGALKTLFANSQDPQYPYLASASNRIREQAEKLNIKPQDDEETYRQSFTDKQWAIMLYKCGVLERLQS